MTRHSSRLITAIVVLSALLFNTTSQGLNNAPQPNTIQPNADIEQIYRRSGLAEEVAQFPATIRMLVSQTEIRYGQPPLARRAGDNAMTEAYAAERLEQYILSYLRNNLGPAQIKAVLTWFDSPLGKKIEQLERAAATTHGHEAMQLYNESLPSGHPDNQYVLQAQTLISASQAIETGLRIYHSTQLATITALLAKTPDRMTETLRVIAADIESSLTEVKQIISREITLSTLFTYQSLSNEEMSAYISFLQSHVGRHYQQVLSDALNNGLISIENDLRNLLIDRRHQIQV